MFKPLFIVIGGAIGIGKTTLAYGIKNALENVAIIENDSVRRTLMGFDLRYFMNHTVDDSFSETNNKRVLERMHALTEDALSQNSHVIQTPVKSAIDDYKMYETLYPQALFVGLFLQAPDTDIRDRLRKRKHERENLADLSEDQGHASDADEAVLSHLPILNTAPAGWHVLDASEPPEAVLKKVLQIIYSAL